MLFFFLSLPVPTLNLIHYASLSTVRIPFLRNIRTTVQSAYKGDGVLWFIIRGLEAMPVILGDLELPITARLRIAKRTNVLLHNGDFITLANVSSDLSGALLRIQFDASGADYTYLEACMRLYNDGASTPLYLSSGAEDYFLSSSYFDEGMFKTPNSGMRGAIECNLFSFKIKKPFDGYLDAK